MVLKLELILASVLFILPLVTLADKAITSGDSENIINESLSIAAVKDESAVTGDSEDTSALLEDAIFATVDGYEIGVNEFRLEYQNGIRESFYHGKISEKEIQAFRKRTVKKLITDVLLWQEAKRRKLEYSIEAVETELKKFDDKRKSVKDWGKNKDKVLSLVEKQLQRTELIKALKADVSNVSKPDQAKVVEYYGENQDKFTAPERWKVSVILLSVDPSSPTDVWDEAVDTAEEIVDRIRDKGESFEDLARIHSGDPSAPDGGDMGYIHIGMLSKPAQDVLNIMKVGEISEPVLILKGVSVFRLDGIQKPRLNKLTKVSERAAQLLMRKSGKEDWSNLAKNLLKTKSIVLAEEFKEYQFEQKD